MKKKTFKMTCDYQNCSIQLEKKGKQKRKKCSINIMESRQQKEEKPKTIYTFDMFMQQ